MPKVGHSYTKSAIAFDKAQQVMVGGVNSPVRAFKSVGGKPVFVKRAEGPFIYDVDDNCYIDLVGSWGPAIVGHAHPAVIDAVKEAAENGLSFGASCELEYQLAELVCSALPTAEQVRFVSSGTEAVMSAIRLARGATDRSKIIKFQGCYHGHSDGLLVSAGSGALTMGVPDSAGVTPEIAALTLLAPYNNLQAVETLFIEHTNEIAAVIVEPIAGNMGFIEPSNGFLAGLRDLCDRNQSILIFDEVMTGFRVGWGGVQVLENIKPNITCLGKVIGGGMPVAAYAASSEIMSLVSPLGPVYQAGTLSGNPVAMAAGLATLKICKQPGFYDNLNQKTTFLADSLKETAAEVGVTLQTGARGGMFGMFFSEEPVTDYAASQVSDHAAFARFFHEMLDLGIWLPPSGYEAMFMSSAHEEEHLTRILEAAKESFSRIKS